jgi:hypothetical protein
MAVQHRKHLILPTIDRDEATGAWIATAHIQFTQKLTFYNVIIRASSMFPIKKAAETHIVQQAKVWIDERLRSESDK